MEAMDLVWAASRDISYVLFNHPFLSLLGSFVLGILLLRFYCRLTVGMCDSDQDMTGKTVLITGASAGIGLETAKDLARRNARVIMGCRNLSKGQAAAKEIIKATGNTNVIVKALELESYQKVRECAKDIIRTEKKLHVLINNAGIFASENQNVMQVNHYSHFLLTLMLLDLLKQSAPSRIINVSSGAYKRGNLYLDDPDDKKRDIRSDFQSYSNSKLANILFTRELSARLKNTGVTVNALHPGVVETSLMRDVHSFGQMVMKVIFYVFGKSPEEGAQTSIYLAVHPDLEHVTGKYFFDCKEQPVTGQASNDKLAKKFFEKSEAVVNYRFR